MLIFGALHPPTHGLLYPLMRFIALFLCCGFVGALVCGIAAVVRARKHLIAHAYVLAVAAYVLLVSAGPEAANGRGERFRSVIMPIVLVYTARGIVEVVGRRRRTRPSMEAAAHNP